MHNVPRLNARQCRAAPDLHRLLACFGLPYWPIDELDRVKNWDTVEVAP
jgi:hypothetical protein